MININVDYLNIEKFKTIATKYNVKIDYVIGFNFIPFTFDGGSAWVNKQLNILAVIVKEGKKYKGTMYELFYPLNITDAKTGTLTTVPIMSIEGSKAKVVKKFKTLMYGGEFVRSLYADIEKAKVERIPVKEFVIGIGIPSKDALEMEV